LPEAGNYNIKDTFEQNKTKAFTIGAPYEHKYDQNPGPGAYAGDQDAIGMAKSGSIRIGREERKDIFADQIARQQELPEAGNYNIKDTFEQNKGKAATFGSPFKQE